MPRSRELGKTKAKLRMKAAAAERSLVDRLAVSSLGDLLVELPRDLLLLSDANRRRLVKAIERRHGPCQRRLARIGQRIDDAAARLRAFLSLD